MQEGLPLYNGAQPVAAQQKFASVPQLPQGQGFGEAFDAAVRDGLQIVDTYTKLHDFAEEQRVEHQLRLNDRKMQEELLQAQNARWGSKGSFFNADGSVNEDNVAAFCSRWRDANDGIERTFLRRDNAIRDAGRMSRQNDDLTTRVELSTMRQALANGKKAFEANYAEAMASGDHAGAARAVAGAVASGHISEAEGQLMLTRAQQGKARKNLDAKPHVERVDAFLAAATGKPATGKPSARKPSAGEETAGKPSAGKPSTGEPTDLTLNGGRMQVLAEESDALTLDQGKVGAAADAAATVEDAGASDLPVAERYSKLGHSITQMCKPIINALTGKTDISAAASEGVQVAVNTANETGGWTLDTYGQAVTSLGLDIVRSGRYEHLSDKDMADMIRETVTVDGMAHLLFGDDPRPEDAYKSYLNGKVDSLMLLRDSKITQRVDAVIEAAEVDLPEDATKRDYVTQRAADALLEYRRKTDKPSKYEEYNVVNDAISAAMKDYSDEAVQKFYESRGAREQAEVKIREEELKVIRPSVQASQAAAETAKAEKKKREAEAKKKPAKAKKPTKEELLKDRPYLGEVDFVFGYKPNDCKLPTMTVPKTEYVEMLRQLECKDGEALYITVGKTELLVLPGDGEESSVNREAVIELTRGMSTKNMRAVIESLAKGVTYTSKVRRGRKQVGKRKTNKNK